VWPAALRDPQPYRPLPTPSGAPDGRFLHPPVQNYVGDPAFAARMAQAETRIIERLQAVLQRGAATWDDIEECVFELGEARQAIARDLGAPFGLADYGRPLFGESTVDFVCDDPTSRHTAYFDRAVRWHEALEAADETIGSGRARAQKIELVSLGRLEEGRLCFPEKWNPQEVPPCIMHPGQTAAQEKWRHMVIVHPGDPHDLPMRCAAYERIATVANGDVPSEEEAMQRLGEAHFLLMHATPCLCGSPSIVETLLDAVLRVGLGRCLPEKRDGIEPFWEAVFTPGSQMAGYGRQFRHLYV
jgi:hypothetical protein